MINGLSILGLSAQTHSSPQRFRRLPSRHSAPAGRRLLLNARRFFLAISLSSQLLGHLFFSRGLLRMLSKSKHFRWSWQWRAWLRLNSCRELPCSNYMNRGWLRLNICRELPFSNYMNHANAMMHNTFCTVAESIKSNESLNIDESPGLPDWVKFSDNLVGANKQDDEDFIPPSISYWIENHKFQNHDDGVEEVDVKSIVNDIVESDVDKVSKILQRGFESPEFAMKALDNCDVIVSDSLLDQVLRRFSCEWRPGLGFFKWAELQRGGKKHSPELYNLMIDNLGKAKKFDTIWELVGEMKKLKGYITLDTMTKIMRRLAKAGMYEDAINTFKILESFGVDRDISAMNILIDAFVKEDSVEDAERLFLEYKESIPPTLHTYNILVHGWCKIREINKAKTVVNEIKQHGLQPDTITYTYFIDAYCREKDFHKVDMTLEEMQENGCHPSIVTYTIMMNALAKAKEINKAVKIYEKMKEGNCSPDAAFYTVFIRALSTSGRLNDANHVFDDMAKQGIFPDVKTYNTLIFLAAQDLQEERALKLLMKMDESLCKPNINTYVPLLRMCCVLNRMKVLSFLLSHMFKNDVSLDLGTYSLLVSRLCKNGNLERACFYFKQLVAKGFIPMHCTYDTLINELEKKGMSEEKQKMEELMMSKNFVRMAPVTEKKSKKSKSKK